MTFGTAAFALTLILAQSRTDLVLKESGSGDLAVVRDLYASAAYEEALTRLDKAEESLDVGQVEQYRALCLLGLGRSNDAQRSLERMVAGNPLYMPAADDVSPRLMTMFHDVRRRLLPAVVRDLYVRAKTNYDGKNFVIASAQFGELLAILVDEDMKDQAVAQSDLKMLAEGFLKLANSELVTTVKASAAAATGPAPAPASAAPAAAAPAAPAIYTDADADVKAPTDIQRRMPPWMPPTSLSRGAEDPGILEVVINENGVVETAVIRKSITGSYDTSLLKATGDWRFQPATRNGKPVKYRKTFQIVLSSAK